MTPSESRVGLGSKGFASDEDLSAFVPDPTISLVVTCYNYGHFLESCLVSLLSQTRHADELIVVNDGSTDLTAQILERFAGNLHVISTANGGQATAFNVGFGASTGDIVLFVDADDLLWPEAVETIVAHWSRDFTALTYGLETVDEVGRSTGLYAPSIDADRSDNRPRLLATGTFCFPPTSGTAFSRHFLEAVLPMPEERWRISADCYLIRAAALFGRFGHIPQVLGSYRLHGGNNYAFSLDEVLNPFRETANRQDIADALTGLADVAELFVDQAEDTPILREALRYRAQKLQGAGFSLKLRRVGPGKHRNIPQPDFRRSDGLRRSRWPVRLPYDRWIDLTSAGAPDIKVPRPPDGTTWSTREAEIDFVVDPTPRDLVATVGIDPGSSRSKLALTLNGDIVWEGMPGPTLRPRFSIPRSPWAVVRRFLLVLRWEAGAAEPPYVSGIELSTNPEPVAPYLDDRGLRPITEILTSPQDSADWQAGSDGSAAMCGDAAHLRFSALSDRPHALLLDLGPDPSPGWLTVTSEGRPLFTGTVGSTPSLSILLPFARGQATKHDLMLYFEPAVGSHGPGLHIFAIGLRGLDLQHAPAPLNLGEKALCVPQHPGERLLGSGWAPAPDGEGYYNLRPEAALSLELPHEADDLTLRLNLEPGLEATPGLRHIVGVTDGGEWLAVAQLDGPGAFDVPLPTLPAGEAANLVVHSAYVPDAAEALADMSLAMVMLKSIELIGTARSHMKPSQLQPRFPSHSFQRLTRQVTSALERGHAPVHCHELNRLRNDLSNELVGCDDKALLLLVADEAAMRALARLGEAVAGQSFDSHGLEQLLSSRSVVGKSAAVDLRTWLLSMLYCPAYETPLPPSIFSLPAPLFWHREALAGYLGRSPELHNKSAHHAYRAFLIRLLREIDVILSREDPEGPHFRFAASVLSSLRSTVAIFGSGSLRDLIRLRSRCIERLLLRSGARLAKAYRSRQSRDVIRVGVLVRDMLPNPEGWAVLGMYSGLDRERFHPVLIRMDKVPGGLDTSTIFAEELCLSRKSTDRSVASIRALDLDLFLTGCYATDWEKTSAILAHRLAPLQVWHTAVCPTTSGFSSFDIALSCRASEPADADVHYNERLAWIDGPLQSAYAFPPHPPSASKDDVRRELGLDAGVQMLVSGAMAYKLSNDLLARWTGILSAVPNSVLVLYPFAANWSLDFAATLRNRVNHHLTGQGIDCQRVVILKSQTPDQVRNLLSAADLYLDSFPYTGATTVCEALASGTPVLTCAGNSLRELTGASWIRAFGLAKLVTNSPTEYQMIATQMLGEKKTLDEVRQQLQNALAEGKPHCDPMRFGAAFSRALWEIASSGDRNLPSGEF